MSLTTGFFSEVEQSLDKLNSEKNLLTGVTRKVSERVLERILFMIKDLKQMRLEKIVSTVSEEKRIENVQNLTSEERDFFLLLSESISKLFAGEKLQFSFKTKSPESLGKIPKESASSEDFITASSGGLSENTSPEGLSDLTEQEDQESLVIVRIIKEIKPFLGTNELTYGPLSPGDLARMPRLNARALVKKSLAEMAEVDI